MAESVWDAPLTQSRWCLCDITQIRTNSCKTLHGLERRFPSDERLDQPLVPHQSFTSWLCWRNGLNNWSILELVGLGGGALDQRFPKRGSGPSGGGHRHCSVNCIDHRLRLHNVFPTVFISQNGSNAFSVTIGHIPQGQLEGRCPYKL